MSTPIRRALYGRLAGDTTLTGLLATPPSGKGQSIYHDQASEGAEFPYVVFSKSSGVPTDSFNTPGAYVTDVWMVKAVDHNTSADLAEQIADRLNVLLNDATLSISGTVLMALRRQSDVQYPEVTNGEMYKHAGALYRVVYEAV